MFCSFFLFLDTQEALNSEKSINRFCANGCLAVVSVDQNAQFCNIWCLKQPFPARKLMFLKIRDFLWISNIQLAIAKMLFKKVYIGSWELAKHTILKNLMSKTIVSCLQINDFEMYRFFKFQLLVEYFQKCCKKVECLPTFQLCIPPNLQAVFDTSD